MEIWKIIDDYPEYEVSTYGNIRSIDRIFIDSIGRKYYKKSTKFQGVQYLHVVMEI